MKKLVLPFLALLLLLVPKKPALKPKRRKSLKKSKKKLLFTIVSLILVAVAVALVVVCVIFIPKKIPPVLPETPEEKTVETQPDVTEPTEEEPTEEEPTIEEPVKREPSVGLAFTSNDNGTCYVSGIGSCTDSEILIPSQSPEEENVVGIGTGAFSECAFIVSVEIPETVKSIGEKAFSGCVSLKIVMVPDSVESIGDKAFSDCANLETVTLPETAEIGTDVFRGSISVEIIAYHDLTFVEAKDATCNEPGNIAHYRCLICGRFFEDENGTVRLFDVSIPSAHEFVDGVCIHCEAIQSSILITGIDEIPYLGKFAYGTLEDAIGLPEEINVRTADEKSHSLSILWDLSGYDKSTVGEYTIYGHIQAAEYQFAEGLTSEVHTGIEIVDFMKGTADIVFILDISGSMGDKINNVKNNIISFAQAVEKQGVSARWSVVTFSDYTEFPESNLAEQTQVIRNGASDWFISADEYRNAIASISLANGGDIPEADVDGLMMASTLSTRKDVRTFYILLTDADYKVNNHYGVSSLQEAATILEEKGVNASVITTSSLKSTYAPLTDTTGGIWYNINGNFAQELENTLVPIIHSNVVE